MGSFKIGDDIEENSQETKKESNGIIPIVIVVVVAIIIGLTVFFVSNAIFNPKKKEVKEEVTTTKLSLDDDNVQILYSYVTYGTNNSRNAKFVKENEVTLDSFSNYELFYYALMFANADDFEDTGNVDDANNKIYNISNSKIKNYMERFFGGNVEYSTSSEIDYTFRFTINGMNIGKMKYNAAKDGFDTVFSGTDVKTTSNIEPFYGELSSASSSSDGKLEIKEKIIYTDTVKNDGIYTINIYKDYGHTKLIDSITNLTDSTIVNTEVSIDEYINKASTITYVFNTYNNIYYFESSSIDNN